MGSDELAVAIGVNSILKDWASIFKSGVIAEAVGNTMVSIYPGAAPASLASRISFRRAISLSVS